MASATKGKIMDDIKSLKIQGASEVAKAGVLCLKMSVENMSPEAFRKNSTAVKSLQASARKIISLRPTEPALHKGLKFIISDAISSGKSKDELRKRIIKMCDNYIEETGKVILKVAQIGSRLVEDGDTIMTHCHSHTVVAILKKAKKDGKTFDVLVTETRPLLQGKTTAKELSDAKIPVTYIVDSAAAFYMKDTTKVLVGADAISSEGFVTNKIGTYLIAIAAKKFNVPVIVACASHKFDPKTVMGFIEPIEKRPESEIIEKKDLSAKNIKIENPAFDTTPPEYIQYIVTENGCANPFNFLSIKNLEEK